MEAFLIILSILLIAGGIIFSILPPLPGPLLTYGALICTHTVSNDTEFSSTSFIIWAIIGVIILVADYVLPVAATKKFGGTKAGVVGGMIGMVAGVLLPIPFGIILGPLLGAIIGDLYGGNRIKSAFKSGFGSFLGFLAATGLKLLYSIILGGIIAWKVGGFTVRAIVEML
ncbi:DUF456 domain-containing protein [Ekhidna sp.]|uniref:DUF456 domain-containing protein n=1 Tax=Ekhidna sp. TaxID=2608089 RepID=UPI003C7B77C2